MRSPNPSVGSSAATPYDFGFVPFDLDDLIEDETDAPEEAAVGIDYGRLQSAIKRDRGWYR